MPFSEKEKSYLLFWFKNKFKKKLPVRTVQIEAIKKNENNCIITSYSNFMYKLLQNMINWSLKLYIKLWKEIQKKI